MTIVSCRSVTRMPRHTQGYAAKFWHVKLAVGVSLVGMNKLFYGDNQMSNDRR
jgi:hypothetical protein